MFSMSESDIKLTPPQQEIVNQGLLESGFHTLLQMPTGAGKTWLAESAIRNTLKAGRKAIYLSPLRSLASELLLRWTDLFAPHAVGVFTGDYGVAGKPYPRPFADSDLLIMTPERLDSCTRNWRNNLSWLSQVDLIVVDEFHLLGDDHRGGRLEGTLLRAMRVNPFARLLCLSATLGNLPELSDWLGGVSYRSDWRPIPLSWRVATFKKATQKPDVLAEEVAATVSAGGKVLVFVQSRRRAEDLAADLRQRGFRAGHHHAGLSMAQRSKVEGEFRGSELDVLSCTPTMEMGVNLPIRTVILYDIQRYDGRNGYVPLSVNTVFQRVGRAGRPGLDTTGEAVLIAPAWNSKEAKNYPAGNFEPIQSALWHMGRLAEQIVAEVASGLCRSETQLARAFGASLAARQRKLPTLSKVTRTMLDAGMLKEVEEDGKARIKATRLGRICSRHLLSPDSVLLFKRVSDAESHLTFFDLALVACCAADCEPVMYVNFEDIEEMEGQVAQERSYLLQRSKEELTALLGVSGKRLLSAIRMALVLRHWTRNADADAAAEANGAYSFEVIRLKDSLERLLLAMGAVFASKDDENEDEPEWIDPESVCLVERLTILQKMAACGLNEENATLALIDGIGPKLARRLMEAGIGDIEELACATAEEVKIEGVSEERLSRWIEKAEELTGITSALRYREDDAPFVSFDAEQWPQEIDPYRLRRSLDLTVSHQDAGSWIVTGGTDPHRVTKTTCDCPDFAKGHLCKHLLALRRARGDQEIIDLAARLEDCGEFSLFALWTGTDSIF